MSDNPYHNRRRQLLINKDFQIQFMKNLVFLNIAICSIFYMANAYFFWEGRELGRSINLSPDHVFFRFLDEQQRSLNIISFGTMVVVSGLIIAFGLVYSHRIAGPMCRLQKYFREKAEGTEKGKLSFRKNDYFQEVTVTINDYFEKTDGHQAAGKSKSNGKHKEKQTKKAA